MRYAIKIRTTMGDYNMLLDEEPKFELHGGLYHFTGGFPPTGKKGTVVVRAENLVAVAYTAV